jgi:hypothetical protein
MEEYRTKPDLFVLLFEKKLEMIEMMKNRQLGASKYKALQLEQMKKINQ